MDFWFYVNVEILRGICLFDGILLGGERFREERGDRIGLIFLEFVKILIIKFKYKESIKI